MTHWVNTVTGSVHPNELGKTLTHEHFVFGYPGYQGDLTLASFNAEEALSIGINVAERLLSYGVRTVVDATPNDCGRNPELLHEISVHTGLQIICATGYYHENAGASAYFKMRSSYGDIAEEIYEMFMTEITHGIEKTGIKPGVITLASSRGAITDYERAFFRAAARAQRETGIPIMTQTQDGTMGPEQADLLISEGADPVRIVIGHMDGNTNVAYHHETLKRGVTVGFDHFGLETINPLSTDSMRETLLIGLLGIGYGHKIVLSHGTVSCWYGRPFRVNEEIKASLSKWKPTHIFENVLPVLREAGVTEEQLQQIFEHNPQSVFGG